MTRIPIFVPEPFSGARIAQPFEFKFAPDYPKVIFADGLPESFFAMGADFVPLEDARVVVLPNSFATNGPAEQAYIQRHVDAAASRGIPLFLFCLGDLTDAVRFDPRAYVFRQSVYRSSLHPQDIVMPTLAADLGVEGIVVRPKGKVPVVSFCGQAGYATFAQWVKYYIKVALYRITALAEPHLRARIIGVYWRRRMIAACRRAPLTVRAKFILRRSFSGAQRTIELDPVQARREFVGSIVESDFVLAPKGDGNYSNRFLEALSLGRIPVLLDTESVLPLEEEIDYDSLVVRVPMRKVGRTPAIVRRWYDAVPPEEWERKQQAARELFATRLRLDAFFGYFFGEVVPRLPAVPPSRRSRRIA